MNAAIAVEDVITQLRKRYGLETSFGNSRLLRFGNQISCSINYSTLLRGHRYFFGLAKEVVDEGFHFAHSELGEFTLLVCGAPDNVLVIPRKTMLDMMQGVDSRRVDIFCADGSYILQTTKHPKLCVTQFMNAFPAAKSFSSQPPADDPPVISREHVKMQWTLIQIGVSEGCSVWVPPADRCLSFNRIAFADLSLERLPNLGIDEQTRRIVQNIDVLWLKGNNIQRAFEVESTTSIYSGLLRLNDLVLAQPNTNIELFIASSESRRQRVMNQMLRPSFQHLLSKCGFVSFEALGKSLEAIDGLKDHEGVRVTGLIRAEYFQRPAYWTYPADV